MHIKIQKIFFLSTFYLLLATFLTGCGTAPRVIGPRFKETVTVGGTRYVSTESLCRIYDLDSQWDAITRKLTLSKDDKEVRVMAESATVLLNDTVHTMDKEARVYRGEVVIPQSFAQRTLAPFFIEEYVEREVVRISSGPIKSVIIDPGHGGKDPGAIGRGGLKEKDVVLDIAQRLKRKLSSAGIDVILTRRSDKFISLAQRSLIANRDAKGADFFIAIHANASRSRWVSGVEVFYLSDSIDDNLRAAKAAQNYDLNIQEAYSGKNTKSILWSLTYKENRKSSIELAKELSHALSKNLSQKNRGEKPARFYVLKANIPATLIEAGFISNTREEKRLKDISYRDRIAAAIAKGISQYNRKFSEGHTARY